MKRLTKPVKIKKALEGVRIADFSWYVAAPYGTMLLAFMGAEVIKVESAARPDLIRKPAHIAKSLKDGGTRDAGYEMSAMFNNSNCGKLGIRLNLGTPKGCELAKRLVKVSTGVIENFRPGVMDKLGLGYSALKEVKPDIIMVSQSPSGSTGPESHYRGYAVTFGALSGVASLAGFADGAPAELRTCGDARVALTVVFPFLAALNHWQRTGEGQHIEVAAREALSCLIGHEFLEYTMNGRVPFRDGNKDRIMAPHGCYRCQGEDNWISIAIRTEEEWQRFVAAMGSPDWAKADRFSDEVSRWRNQDELDRLIQSWTINYTHLEVMKMLQKVGVAAVPSFSAYDLYHDPHLQERGFLQEVQHPAMGKLGVLGPPWKFSATPAQVYRAAPLLGEHNAYVYGELLGMSSEEIARLEQEGVIY